MKYGILFFALGLLILGVGASEVLTKVNLSFSNKAKPNFRTKATQQELDNFHELDWPEMNCEIYISLIELNTGADEILLAKTAGYTPNSKLTRIVNKSVPRGKWIEKSSVRACVPRNGETLYWISPFTPNGQYLTESVIQSKYRNMYKYLSEYKEKLDLRKEGLPFYAPASFRVVQNWIPLDKVFDFVKEPKNNGYYLFNGAVAVFPDPQQQYSFFEKDANLKNHRYSHRMAGVIAGSVFLADIAVDGEKVQVVERLQNPYEAAKQNSPDLDDYLIALNDSSERLFKSMLYKNDIRNESQYKRFLIALQNAHKIGSMK